MSKPPTPIASAGSRARRIRTSFAAVLAVAGVAHGELAVLHDFFADGVHPAAGLTAGPGSFFYGTTEAGGLHGCGSIFKVLADGSGYALVHSFSCGPGGKRPLAPPTPDGQGYLHGTTFEGGFGFGIVYRVKTDGSEFEPRMSFGGTDGVGPRGALAFDGDATFYGTTSEGGLYGQGTVFAVFRTAVGHLKLFDFGAPGAEPPYVVGSRPLGGVLLSEGRLYGTTSSGGDGTFGGMVYSFDLASRQLTILHSFFGGGDDGLYPHGDLALQPGALATLRGTTREGGDGNWGTVYRLGVDGSGFELLHEFAGPDSDGGFPIAGLACDAAANCYGTTSGGGEFGPGVLFHVNATGTTYQLLHHFAATSENGWEVWSGPLLDGAGGLLGTTRAGGSERHEGTIYRIAVNGSDFALLHRFRTDGAHPIGEVAQDDDGNLYGVTQYGGTGGWGVLYRIGADGDGYSVLHSFFSGSDTSRFPLGGPLFVTPNWLYGTAAYGGLAGAGALFRARTNGDEFEIVHSFAGGAEDGAVPWGQLSTLAGTIHGATAQGGEQDAGTLYRVGADGSGFDLLHSFGGAGDGSTPAGGSLLVGDVVLYGSTFGGGAADLGILFRMSLEGGSYEILHEFAGGDGDGARPRPPALYEVASAALDRLYFATREGGVENGGTIHRMDVDSFEAELLLPLPTAEADPDHGGVHPGLTSDGGNLFGFDTAGGEGGQGELFRLRHDGSGYEALHAFAGGDGRVPRSLRFDTGRLVGTTAYGGAADQGALFVFVLPEIFAGDFELGDFSGWSGVAP